LSTAKFLLVFTLLLAIPALAQDTPSKQDLPDAPKPQPNAILHAAGYPFVSIARTARDMGTFKDREASALAAVDAGTAVSDGIMTEKIIKEGGYEANPVMRAFIGRRPTLVSMAPWGAAEVLGTYWLGEKMHRSRTWIRHIWWLPQAAAISSHIYGTAHNIEVER
jgi:hypothetical protein